jgi:hypothetical protein
MHRSIFDQDIAMQGRDKYYFLHIPKTAGCTMAYRMLPKFFDPKEICPHTTFDGLLSMGMIERERYRLFHGHFNAHLQHFVPGPLRILTLLRHPVERAISQYRYILSSPSHPLHGAVTAERDFGGYIRNRLLFAPNSLTLALGSRFDPAEVLRRAALRGISPTAYDSVLDDETFNTAARKHHLDAAKALLDSCVLVGLQEDMSGTAALLHRHFGCDFDGAVDSMNATQAPPLGRADLSDSVLAELAALHEHDLELYAHGKALFERSCAAAEPVRAISAPVPLEPEPAASRLYYMTLPWSGDVDLASQLLQGFCRPAEICPAWNYDGLYALPPETRAAYRAYHGYFFWPLESFVGAPLSIITFLTDPAERAAQQYRERLSDRAHKLHQRIKAKHGLAEFLRDPVAYTPNVLTLSLARRFGPEEIARLQREARRDGISLNDALGEYVAERPATRRDLARAKRRLAQCAFIGFAESFDASLAALGRQLDWPDIALALTPATRRRAATPTEVSATDRAAVAEVDHLDTELYAFARRLMRDGKAAPRFSPARLFGRLLARPPMPAPAPVQAVGSD